MKKKLVVFAIALFGILQTSVNAQTSFSCYHREYCYWNENTELFEDCEGYEEPSLFVMNADETMFTHTIETMKSTYYVSESEYDEQYEVWSYTVKSDVGNEYIYIFDPKNKEIRVLFMQDGETVLLRFYVKAIF